jgi:Carboxypeptidase regulatory-like domain/TonB dependent receptor
VKVRSFVVLFAACCLLFASGIALSQTVQGVITGTVTDPTGASVPGATVTITNTGTNAVQTATTGSDGSYRFPLVPPGTYLIDIKAANFAEVRASGIVVQASQTVPFDVKLEIAKTQATIEVTEQATLVQTATSDLATQVDRTTIENAPLADRDVFSTLPFLAPQVTPGLDMMPTSGGARESGTAYLLNGADDNDNFSEGAINIHPPLESVQDFTIKTNSMSAEYGRGAGAVVSANQKTGSNRFHGVAYEFNRNATLNANDFFYDRDLHNQDPTAPPLPNRPKYIRNQFGGEVDGPIIKDKTFFSFAYDRFKILSGSTAANNYVPTSAAITNVKAVGGALAQQILSAFPPVTSDSPCPSAGNWTLPNGNDSGMPVTGAGKNPNDGLPNAVGCLSFFDPKTDTNDVYYGRIDHNFSSKDRLSFAANIYRESFVDQFGGGPLTTAGATPGTTTNHFHQLSLNETHIFSPRLINEVTLAHNRHFNVFIEGDGKTTIPNIYVDNQTAGCLAYQLGGPFEGGQVEGFVQDRWGITDNLTWTLGRHSLKFGGGSQYGILYRNWDLGLPGQYEFGDLDTVDAPPQTDALGNPTAPATCAATSSCPQITPASDGTLQGNGTISGVADPTHANFTNDYPYFQETSSDPRTGAKASAYRHYTYHDYYFFAQDDWKLTARLTLNLGMRWDRYGAPSEDHNIMAQFTNLGGTCGILSASCIAAARVTPVSRMWNTQNHDFAPRIGFAWDIFGNGKMAVRGGYGIYYDRIFDNIWSNGAWNPPFYALLDFDATAADAIFYANPASSGPAYDPNGPCGQIPYAPCATDPAGKRVSVRTMDVNMKDTSGQNFYLGVEHQFWTNFLLRVNYQGSLGRHLPMLENYNRLDGIGYYCEPNPPNGRGCKLTPTRPNPLYTGFNYRSNSVSSSYNSLVAEVQKRMSNGLQFQTGYTYSKLLDLNSELFAGCSTIGGLTGTTAPYYYVTNSQQNMYRGPASFDHRHAYKFSVTYELPFLKNEKGFLGHAFGGWQLGSFFQLYSGHPMDVYNGRTRIRARDGSGALLKDQNGVPFNIGGDYNLDGVANDHPDFIGSSVSSVYSGNSPADGFFTDNNRIGCATAGVPSTVSFSTSSSSCPGTPNTLFANPAYPSGSTPYERFGTLGRGVFHGPRFSQLDLGLSKSFRITEGLKLDFRAQAQNLLNHPSFECMVTDLSSSNFGKAQCLAQSVSTGLGAPVSRVMSLGLRIAF